AGSVSIRPLIPEFLLHAGAGIPGAFPGGVVPGAGVRFPGVGVLPGVPTGVGVKPKAPGRSPQSPWNTGWGHAVGQREQGQQQSGANHPFSSLLSSPGGYGLPYTNGKLPHGETSVAQCPCPSAGVGAQAAAAKAAAKLVGGVPGLVPGVGAVPGVVPGVGAVPGVVPGVGAVPGVAGD
ncbi:ELN protein, partial [Chloropsis hardwickii]|nr:ELN protein [Chloropsis hardwickii]